MVGNDHWDIFANRETLSRKIGQSCAKIIILWNILLKKGHNIFVYDKDNNYIDSFPSITKAAKAYDISLTTLWRGLQDGRTINNYYFKEEL